MKDYCVVSPELFRTAPKLLKCIVAGLPRKSSAEECSKPRKTREKPDAQCQMTRGVQDERALEALRASVRELMPPTLVNRQQKEQLLKQEAIVVVESLRKNPHCANSKDGPRIQRLEEKSSVVRCSAGRRDRKKQVDDSSAELDSNVVFENISSEETFGASSKISCSKEMQDFKATDLKKRRIQDDLALGCKQTKITRLSSDVKSEAQPHKTSRRSLLRIPVLKEMTVETNCIVAAQQTEETRSSKKPIELPSTKSPLSHRQLLFLKQVVNKMISPVKESQVDPSIQNENDTGSTESCRDRKQDVHLLTSSLNPVSSVVDSQASVIITRLSEEISVPGFLKNQVELLSSTANKLSPLKQNNVKRNEEDKVIDQQCSRKDQNADSNFSSALSPCDRDDILHSKRSSLMRSTELLNRNHFETTELGRSVALNSNETDLKPSSVLPSEFSNSDSFERWTLNQPWMYSRLKCETLNPLKIKISVQSCVASHQLVDTKAKCIDSDKFHVIKDETKDLTSLPDSAKKHQFPKIVTMLIDACLNADEGTRFSGRDSIKKFVDAISSFLTPVSYPPSATLTVLLKILVEVRFYL